MIISRPNSRPISSTASSLSDTVTVTASPWAIMNPITLAGETPSRSPRSLTVMPDGTLTGPVGSSGSRLGSGLGPPRSRRMPGLRPACASITTRRLVDCAPRRCRATRAGWPGCCEGTVALAPNAFLTSSSSTSCSSPRGHAGAGIGKLLLYLCLCDPAFAGDFRHASLCHCVLQVFHAAAGVSTLERHRYRRR